MSYDEGRSVVAAWFAAFDSIAVLLVGRPHHVPIALHRMVKLPTSCSLLSKLVYVLALVMWSTPHANADSIRRAAEASSFVETAAAEDSTQGQGIHATASPKREESTEGPADYFAFQAKILDVSTGAISALESVPSGALLDKNPGLLFEPGEVEVRANGLSITGTGTGFIHHPQLRPWPLTVKFSTDFVIGTSPFRIITGRAEFRRGVRTIAYVDRDGLHIPKTQDDLPSRDSLLAKLPANLPLPDSRLAYLRIRQGGQPDAPLLVDAQVNADGSVSLSGAQGSGPTLHIPSVGTSTDARFASYLTIDPVTLQALDGKVEAIQGPENPIYDFDNPAWNLPFLLTGVDYDPQVGGLHLSGHFKVLEGLLPQKDALRYRVGENGRAAGTVDRRGGADIRVAGDSDRVTLRPKTLSAFLDLPLLGAVPSFDVDLNAVYRIQQNGQLAAGATVQLHSTPGGLRTSGVTSLPDANTVPLRFDGVELELDGVKALDAVYRTDGSQMLRAELRANIGSSAVPFSVPLDHVQLDAAGFFLPTQTFEQSESTGSSPSTFDYGPLAMRVIAMRLSETTFDWFRWSPGTPTGIDPAFDFDARLQGFAGTSSRLAQESLTVQDARIEDGGLRGELIERTLSGGAEVPVGEASIRISTIAGEITPVTGADSGADIQFQAALAESNGVSLDKTAGGDCTSTIELSLVGDAGFSGSGPYTLCGTVARDRLSLAYEPDATLEFLYENDTQAIHLSGSVTATIQPGPSLRSGTGSGTVAMNLADGTVLNESLELQNVRWDYPSSAPVFSFRADRAGVAAGDLTFSGDGRVATSGDSARVVFDALTVPFENPAITSGEVRFEESIVLGAALPTVDWHLPGGLDLPTGAADEVRMSLPAGQVLSSSGMMIDGSARGAYTHDVSGQTYAESGLEATYDQLQFSFDTVIQVESGEATLSQNGNRQAWVNADGFFLEDVPATQQKTLPDRLALGKEDIGYLRIRKADGSLLVDVESTDSGGWRVRTRPGEPAPVVFAGLGDAEGTLEYDVRVTNALKLRDINATGLADTAAVDGTPLRIHEMTYSQADGLIVRGNMGMDGALADLSIPFRATVASSGFAGGDVLMGVQPTGHHDPAYNAEAPIDTVRFDDSENDIAEAVTVLARGATMNYANQQFTIHGDIASPVFGGVELNPDAGCAYGESYEQAPGPLDRSQTGGSGYAASATMQACAATVHYRASWQGNSWEVTPEAEAAGGTLPIGKKGTFEYVAGGLTVTTGSTFALEMEGTLAVPGISVGLDVAVNNLHLGSDSLYAEPEQVTQQQIEIRRNLLVLRPDSETLRISVRKSGALAVRFDGDMMLNTAKVEPTGTGEWTYLPEDQSGRDAFQPAQAVRDRSLQNAYADAEHSCSNAQVTANPDQTQAMLFEDMRLDTDGGLSFGEGEVNLLAGYRPVALVGDKVCIDYLGIGSKDGETEDDQVPFIRLGVVADIPTLSKKKSIGRRTAASSGTAGSDSSHVQMTGIVQTSFTDNSFEVDLYGVFDGGTTSSGMEQLQAFNRDADQETREAFFQQTYDPTINNSPLEVSLFDKAVLEVTGLGLELDFENVDYRVSTALAVHVYRNKKSSGTGSTATQNAGSSGTGGSPRRSARIVDEPDRTAPDGRWYTTMMFGDPRKLADGGGIWFRFSRGQYDEYTMDPDSTGNAAGNTSDDGGSFFTVEEEGVGKFSMGWNLTAESGSGLLSLNGGLFSATLTKLHVNPQDSYVTMDGNASLDLSKVQGQFGIKGFTAGRDTFSIGRPQGPFMLAVDNYMAMEVGCIDWGSRQPGQSPLSFKRPLEKRDESGVISLKDTTITNVENYFQFSACTDVGNNPGSTGGRALRLAVFSNKDPNTFVPTSSRYDQANNPGAPTTRDSTLFKGSLFSGSVRQIVFYEQTNGDTYFKLDRAELAMGGSGQVEASIRGSIEVQTQDSNVGIELSGLGQLGVGKDPTSASGFKKTYAFTAIGKFSNIDDELSMGFFLGYSGLTVPIVPGVVDLKGAGGGFFWNPDEDDVSQVYTNLRQMTGGQFKSQNPNGLPRSDNLKLAVMLYAQAGIGGSGGTYAAEAFTLVTVTDQFFTLDLAGVITSPDANLIDNEAGSAEEIGDAVGRDFTNMEKAPGAGVGRVKFGGYLTVLWQDHIRGLQGGVALYYAERAPGVGIIATGQGKIDVFFQEVALDDESGTLWKGAEENRPDAINYDFRWGIAGYLGYKLFPDNPSPSSPAFIKAEAGLIINDAGFLFGLDYTIDKDIAIVNLYAHAGIEFWYNAVRQEIGAFAEAEAEVRIVVLGHARLAVELGLVNDNGYMLFGSGSGTFAVFNFIDVHGPFWFSAKATGSGLAFDGGTGRNDRFRDLVAESQSDLREAAEETQATMEAVRKASRSLSSFTIDPDEAQEAGRILVEQEMGVRRDAAADMRANERQFDVHWSTAEQKRQTVANEIIEGTPITGDGETGRANALQTAIDRIETRASALEDLYDDINFELYEAEFLADSLEQSTNPVSCSASGSGSTAANIVERCAQEGFSIDSTAVQKQQEQFLSFQEAAALNSMRFVRISVDIIGILRDLDALLYGTDNSLDAFGDDFATAVERNGDLMIARRTAILGTWAWAEAGLQWLDEEASTLAHAPNWRSTYDGEQMFDFSRKVALLSANRAAFINDLNDGTYDGGSVTVGQDDCSLSGKERYTAFATSEWNSLQKTLNLNCPTASSNLTTSQWKEVMGTPYLSQYIFQQQIRTLAEKNARGLWVDMPSAALEAIRTDLTDTVFDERVTQPYTQTIREEINPLWSDYSRKVDQVYTRKSRITERLAGMFEAYGEWAEAQPDSVDLPIVGTKGAFTAERAFETRKNLLETLRAPEIKELDVTTTPLSAFNYEAFAESYKAFNYSGTRTGGTNWLGMDYSGVQSIKQRPVTRVELTWATEASVEFNTLFDSWLKIETTQQAASGSGTEATTLVGSVGQRTSFEIPVMRRNSNETGAVMDVTLGVRSRGGAQFRFNPRAFVVPLEEQDINGYNARFRRTRGESETDDLVGSRYFTFHAKAKMRGADAATWVTPAGAVVPFRLSPTSRSSSAKAGSSPFAVSVRPSKTDSWTRIPARHLTDGGPIHVTLDRDLVESRFEIRVESPLGTVATKEFNGVLTAAYAVPDSEYNDGYLSIKEAGYTPTIGMGPPTMEFRMRQQERKRRREESLSGELHVSDDLNLSESTELHADFVEGTAPSQINWVTVDSSGAVRVPATFQAHTTIGNKADSLVFEYRIEEDEASSGNVSSDWQPISGAIASYERTGRSSIVHTVTFTEEKPLLLDGMGPGSVFRVTVRARDAFNNLSKEYTLPGTFRVDEGPPTLSTEFKHLPRPVSDQRAGAIAIRNQAVAARPEARTAEQKQSARPLTAYRRLVAQEKENSVGIGDGYQIVYATEKDVDIVLSDASLITNQISVPKPTSKAGINWDYESSFNPWAYTGSKRDVKVNLRDGTGRADYYRVHSNVGTWEPYYIHFVVEDRLGRRVSETYGPFEASDPTRPQTPAAVTSSMAPTLWLTRPSADPETGVVGYQVALGSGAGKTDLRDWPSGDAPDLTDPDLPSTGSRAAGYDLSPAIDTLDYSGRVYVTVRAINGRGQVSQYVSAGSVPPARDESVPERPLVSVEGVDSVSVRAEIANVYDRESGIDTVRYRVVDGMNASDWTSLPIPQGAGNDANGFLASLDAIPMIIPRGSLGAPPWSIEVQVINGQGLRTERLVRSSLDPACMQRLREQVRVSMAGASDEAITAAIDAEKDQCLRWESLPRGSQLSMR
ncbi:hypothetical protein CRI94_15580 [Longibacter salinarum]|uniref:Uncharacterized protein n=2 Tax=Longibacter salinarum TaxID=1850348 RepID=A0A2A8CUM4_9BACT|nr:hypothetical protein CRI94_15580 [Longibacter salinarum]